jgi:uroporphyrinogen decarboxylase
MNDRQRFLAALTFGKPDRLPLEPGAPRESTLRRWHAEGLPPKADWFAFLMDTLGIPYQPPARSRVDLGVDFKMIPTFEEKVLQHTAGHYIVLDWMGAVTEISDAYDYTYIRSAKDFVTRRWHSFPVQNQADWEIKMRWRYNPAAPGRFPPDFSERCQALQDRDYPLRLSFNGPFWQLREWCGLEGLCTLLVEKPAFVQEMVSAWQDFVLQLLHTILAKVCPDFVMVNEDMAFKLHSMLSPTMVRRFFMPTWQAWNHLLKAHGCPVRCVDSDGYIAELLPLFVEAGFNCTYPLEVAAGNDIVAYRRQYGSQMAFLGGLDKRSLAAGGTAMKEELLRVIPPLLEDGGLIPGCDHGVPPDISWPNFVEYTRLLAQLSGWI